MKYFLFCLIAWSAIGQPQRRPAQRQAPQQQQQPLAAEDYGRVEGSVIHGQTGEPLRKAEVALTRGGEPGPDGDEGGLAITTTEDGKFLFPRVAPGRYSVRVSKTGFTRQGSGWTSAVTAQLPRIEIAKGQSMSGMTIKMLPHGVITGRVLDEDGEPLPRVNVGAFRYNYPNGRKTLSNASSVTTNDLGEYRLWGLTPGVYYVNATPMDAFRPQRKKAEALAPTFFPSAESVDRGTPIQIAPGSQALNIDVRLRKARLFSISGVVTDGGAGNAVTRAAVRVVPNGAQGEATGGGGGGRGATTGTREGGKFTLNGLSAGSYTVQVQVFGNRGPNSDGAAMGTARVELTNEDVSGLQIVAQPNASIPILLKFEGDQAPEQQAYVRVTLEALGAGFANGMVGGSSKDGNKFTITNVAADRYRIRVSGVPQGFYLRNVQQGNQDVRFTGLDFTAGGASSSPEITLTLAPSPGSIEGVVKSSAKDEPMTNATVVLIPKEEWTGVGDQIRTATTGAQGEFSFVAIAPGEYEILAFEEIESGAWFDPEVRKRFSNEAKTVKVEKGAAAKMDLKAARP